MRHDLGSGGLNLGGPGGDLSPNGPDSARGVRLVASRLCGPDQSGGRAVNGGRGNTGGRMGLCVAHDFDGMDFSRSCAYYLVINNMHSDSAPSAISFGMECSDDRATCGDELDSHPGLDAARRDRLGSDDHRVI